MTEKELYQAFMKDEKDIVEFFTTVLNKIRGDKEISDAYFPYYDAKSINLDICFETESNVDNLCDVYNDFFVKKGVKINDLNLKDWSAGVTKACLIFENKPYVLKGCLYADYFDDDGHNYCEDEYYNYCRIKANHPEVSDFFLPVIKQTITVCGEDFTFYIQENFCNTGCCFSAKNPYSRLTISQQGIIYNYIDRHLKDPIYAEMNRQYNWNYDENRESTWMYISNLEYNFDVFFTILKFYGCDKFRKIIDVLHRYWINDCHSGNFCIDDNGKVRIFDYSGYYSNDY